MEEVEKEVFSNIVLALEAIGRNDVDGLLETVSVKDIDYDARDLSLTDDLQFDSLDIVEFVMELEIIYDIDIPECEYETWASISDVRKYLLGILLT